MACQPAHTPPLLAGSRPTDRVGLAASRTGIQVRISTEATFSLTGAPPTAATTHHVVFTIRDAGTHAVVDTATTGPRA